MKSNYLKIVGAVVLLGICTAATALSFLVERGGPNAPDRMLVAEFDKDNNVVAEMAV